MSSTWLSNRYTENTQCQLLLLGAQLFFSKKKALEQFSPLGEPNL